MSNPTRKQAESVLAKLIERYDADINGCTIPADRFGPAFTIQGLAEVDHPKLRKGERSGWEVVWEAGPFEWAYRFTSGGFDEETAPVIRAYGGTPTEEQPVEVSPKLFLEPVNTYTVGIYLA